LEQKFFCARSLNEVVVSKFYVEGEGGGGGGGEEGRPHMISHDLEDRDSMLIEVSHENSVDVFARSDSALD